MTHCGWNSVMETVSSGVPMLAWLLYAEQRMNSVVLSEEMGVAIPMTSVGGGGGATELVSAEKVERRVRELMEDDGKGRLVREEQRDERVGHGGLEPWWVLPFRLLQAGVFLEAAILTKLTQYLSILGGNPQLTAVL